MLRTIAMFAAVFAALLVAAPAAQAQWWNNPQAPPGTDAGVEAPPAEAEPEPEPEPEEAPAEAEAPVAGEAGEEEGADELGGDEEGVEEAPPEPIDMEGRLIPESHETTLPIIPVEQPTWRWQQVLAAPRIGGRLTAIAIDPENPNRIFVGSEEYTVLRSTDGGVTWREIEMSPFNVQARTVNITTPGLPRLGTPTPPGLIVSVAPPFRRVPRIFPGVGTVPSFFGEPYTSSPNDTLIGQLPTDPSHNSPVGRIIGPSTRPESGATAGALPDYAFTIINVGGGTFSRTFLADAVRRRRTFKVERLAICPGAEFPLLAATATEILGSYDDGLTWVRLHRLPGSVPVYRIECSRDDPRHILVATGFGLFRSTDGGASFDQDMSGWPGRNTFSVAFGPRNAAGRETVMAAVGEFLFAGDPESDRGLDFIYPDFNNSTTAPWMNIVWIARDGNEIWLATDDGPRRSIDGGQNWIVPSRTLLERQNVTQVEIGTNENGGKRVAIILRECTRPMTGTYQPPCRRSRAYATDDGGVTWFPFFEGLSRRRVAMMAAAPPAEGIPPRWFMLTFGELYVTVPGETQFASNVDRRSQAWARRKLARTPPVRLVIDEMLDQNDLSEEDIESMTDTIRNRNVIPYIYADFELHTRRSNTDFAEGPIAPLGIARSRSETAFELHVFLQWSLRDLPLVTEQLFPVRNEMYELRRQVTFIAEDAWHERVLHLEAIAAGMTDRLQIETLKARIAALEAVIQTWLRRPIEEMGGGAYRQTGYRRGSR